MKILVISDNHGDRQILVEVVQHWYGMVDAIFHCGDSELEPTDELWQKVVVVKGNCDYDPKFAKSQDVLIGDSCIFMTHGHLYGVNTSLESLIQEATDVNANIVLYGHTHKLAAEKLGDKLVVNPGSISQPRGRFSHLKTYAMIEWDEEQYQVTYYGRDHQPIPELEATFAR